MLSAYVVMQGCRKTERESQGTIKPYGNQHADTRPVVLMDYSHYFITEMLLCINRHNAYRIIEALYPHQEI